MLVGVNEIEGVTVGVIVLVGVKDILGVRIVTGKHQQYL